MNLKVTIARIKAKRSSICSHVIISRHTDTPCVDQSNKTKAQLKCS